MTWGQIGFRNPIIVGATVLGDILSLNWDGDVPPIDNGGNTGLPDATANQGYYLRSASGSAQFAGKVVIGNDDQQIEIDAQTWTGTTAIIQLAVNAVVGQLLVSDSGAGATILQALTELFLTAVDSVNIEGFQGGQLPLARIEADDINLEGRVNVNAINLANNIEFQTIFNNEISFESSYMIIDTQFGASTDDLDRITGGTVGDLLFIRQNNSNRDIVIKHNVGNIITQSGTDKTLNFATGDGAFFLFNGSTWLMIGEA